MSSQITGLGGGSIMPPEAYAPECNTVRRPQTELAQNKLELDRPRDMFTNNGEHVRIMMSPGRIRVGCTSITIEAAEKLMEIHRQRFGTGNEITVQ